jgi:hypothetical protein
MDVALASCLDLPEPDLDEAPLLEALAAEGLSAGVLAWDDPAVDWSAARMTVLRATWNYPLRPPAFLEWVEATARVTDLWNRLPAVRWSFHKSYLLDLERQGLAVAPTELVPRGSDRRLADVVAMRDWQDVVVKPAVSAASYRTKRIGEGQRPAGEAHLRALLADGDALVQRYLPSVEDYGERALIWIDGELTHAVRKSPRFDDDDESISAALPIAPAEAALAAAALARVAEATGEPPMYARIDVAPGPKGGPLLMELELIEPSLFFSQSPGALRRFVTAIGRRLTALDSSAPS